MTTTDKTAKPVLHNGQYELALRVALGQADQKELMAVLGLPNETAMTRNMAGILRQVIGQLHEKRNLLQAEVSRLQADVSRLQAVESGLKLRESELQAEVSRLQARESELQEGVGVWKASYDKLELDARLVSKNLLELQLSNADMQAERDELQVRWDSMYGQINPLRTLGSAWAVFLLSIFVMVFDIHALYALYEPKLGVLTASSLAIGIGFSILVFTAAKNRMGRRFAITVTFVIAGLYFEVFQAVAVTCATISKSGLTALTKEMLSPIVGTIVPPAVNAVLTSMLEDGKLEHGKWDWAKVKEWVKSKFK